ncbi:hypothetical protein ACIBSV_03645 [Embleya sp. NPDC050154]|uniref:hypothetical protein n=1 Tax=Embleya sp. NPDC050154 TaxID=3363988 RepID=UPI0037AE7F88
MSRRGRAVRPPRGTGSRTSDVRRRRRRGLGRPAVIAASLAVAVVGILVALLGPSPASGRATPDRNPAPAPGSALPAAVVDRAVVVATVDEVRLTAGELRRAVVRLRAEVVAEFPIAGARADYWHTPIVGRTPHEVLRERSLRAAVGEAVLRRWARQAGVSTDPSEAGFRARLDAENARRAAARAQGRPMPGVPSYDEDGFARNEVAELSASLRESLAGQVDLSESRLRERYAELLAAASPSAGAPAFDQARDRLRLDLLSAAFDRELARRVAAARVVPLPTADTVIRAAE